MDLLEFIHKRIQRDGVPPSFEEMKDALDLRSKSGIHRLITALEERGFIRRLAHKARALEIIRLPDNMRGTPAPGNVGFTPRVIDGERPAAAPERRTPVTVAATEIPVMGKIAAGVPISAISEVSHMVAVPGQMLGRGNHYALEVKGDSMINAGINDGDIVVIREMSEANNGDIVVAVVEGYEATLKRFRRKGGMIALEAANPVYETRLIPEDQVAVQGKLVGLIRTYT
jgi:repressor LexA